MYLFKPFIFPSSSNIAIFRWKLQFPEIALKFSWNILEQEQIYTNHLHLVHQVCFYVLVILFNIRT